MENLKEINADFPGVASDEGMLILKSSQTLLDAINLLAKWRVSAAPLLVDSADGSEKDCHQWFSMLDVINIVSNARDMKTTEIPKQMLEMTLGRLAGQTKDSKTFVAINQKAGVMDAIKAMADNDTHRVAITDDKGALVGVLTDTRVLKLLVATESNDKSHPFNRTLKDLELVGFKAPIWVSKHAPVYQAFEKMKKHQVRSVAVIEEDFVPNETKLCGQISASDLVLMMSKDSEDKIQPTASLPAELMLPVRDFLEWRDAVHPLLTHPECLVYASPDMPLGTCVKKMLFYKVHKLFIVKSDEDKQLVGVLTINDILKKFYKK